MKNMKFFYSRYHYNASLYELFGSVNVIKKNISGFAINHCIGISKIRKFVKATIAITNIENIPIV